MKTLVAALLLTISLCHAQENQPAQTPSTKPSAQTAIRLVNTRSAVLSTSDIKVEFQEHELKQNDDWWSIEIKYPEIAGEDDFNMTVRQHVAGIANDFRNGLPKTASKGYPDYGAYLKGNFKAQPLKCGVVSLLFDYDEYTPGAAHPWGVRASINYDMRKHRALTLSDLFRPHSHYVSRLSQIAIRSLDQREYAEKLTIRHGAGPVERNFKVFTLTDTELVLHFQQYQVAAGAAGVPEPVVIPLATLAPMLREPYRPAQ